MTITKSMKIITIMVIIVIIMIIMLTMITIAMAPAFPTLAILVRAPALQGHPRLLLVSAWDPAVPLALLDNPPVACLAHLTLCPLLLSSFSFPYFPAPFSHGMASFLPVTLAAANLCGVAPTCVLWMKKAVEQNKC